MVIRLPLDGVMFDVWFFPVKTSKAGTGSASVSISTETWQYFADLKSSVNFLLSRKSAHLSWILTERPVPEPSADLVLTLLAGIWDKAFFVKKSENGAFGPLNCGATSSNSSVVCCASPRSKLSWLVRHSTMVRASLGLSLRLASTIAFCWLVSSVPLWSISTEASFGYPRSSTSHLNTASSSKTD